MQGTISGKSMASISGPALVKATFTCPWCSRNSGNFLAQMWVKDYACGVMRTHGYPLHHPTLGWSPTSLPHPWSCLTFRSHMVFSEDDAFLTFPTKVFLLSKYLENTVCDIQEKGAIGQVKNTQDHPGKYWETLTIKHSYATTVPGADLQWVDGKGTLPSQPRPG